MLPAIVVGIQVLYAYMPPGKKRHEQQLIQSHAKIRTFDRGRKSPFGSAKVAARAESA
jgi:hypothetical protein